MARREGDDEAPRLVAGPLALSWRWTGDRWSHVLEWDGDVVARSVEDDGAGRPAYQQLHLQEDGDDWLALLVGQSGRDHYSASFRVGEKGVAVEVAGRGPSAPIACVYDVTSERLALVCSTAPVESQEGRKAAIGPDRGAPTRVCVYSWSPTPTAPEGQRP